MTTLSVPSQDSLSASAPSGRPVMRRPLSTHGRPKPPRAISPPQPQHFSALGFATSESPQHSPHSPRSPGPMSPPMSAKSFGTFIDSEPSTPAYSPRMEQGWDNSNVVLMRPMSSSSEPRTPVEPSWDMVAPVKTPSQYPAMMPRSKPSTMNHNRVPTITSPISPPLPRQPRTFKYPGDIHVVNLNQRDDETPRVTHIEQDKPKSKEIGSLSPGLAPFGKLASKMKLMLRRKNTNEKKKEKKREWEDVDRLEDVHWTEM